MHSLVPGAAFGDRVMTLRLHIAGFGAVLAMLFHFPFPGVYVRQKRLSRGRSARDHWMSRRIEHFKFPMECFLLSP
jgi:hypothetical protein